MRVDLGDTLHALAVSQGSALTDATTLTTRVSRAGRGRRSFRLAYADGRVLKGRSFTNASEAAQSVELSRHLDETAFPRTIAWAESAVLTAWIDGRPLEAATVSPTLVETCGRLLGQLHTTPCLPSLPQRAGAPTADLAGLSRELDELVKHGVLSARHAAQAIAIAADDEPAEWATGLVHDDFCAENMVLDGEGRVWIVDNEHLGLGALDFDLARTWYRWPLSPALREAFNRGYSKCRPLEAFRAHFRFWAISVLASSASFRLRTHDDGVAVPCRRLIDLLETDRAADPLAL